MELYIPDNQPKGKKLDFADVVNSTTVTLTKQRSVRESAYTFFLYKIEYTGNTITYPLYLEKEPSNEGVIVILLELAALRPNLRMSLELVFGDYFELLKLAQAAGFLNYINPTAVQESETI